MKVIEKYQCEVCSEIYDNPNVAIACEGQKSPVRKYKKGDKVVYRNMPTMIGVIRELFYAPRTHRPYYTVDPWYDFNLEGEDREAADLTGLLSATEDELSYLREIDQY